MIRYKTVLILLHPTIKFESFVNLIRYKTIAVSDMLLVWFESFVNLIRYKTDNTPQNNTG